MLLVDFLRDPECRGLSDKKVGELDVQLSGVGRPASFSVVVCRSAKSLCISSRPTLTADCVYVGSIVLVDCSLELVN